MRIFAIFVIFFTTFIPSAFAQQGQGNPYYQSPSQSGNPAYNPANDPLLNMQGQVNLNNTEMAGWFAQTNADVSSIQNDPAWSPIITVQGNGQTTGAPVDTASACKTIKIKSIATLADFVTCTISRSLIPLIFALGVMFLAWGTTMLVLNAGNEEAREKGKSIMIWGLLGFFVLASVWALVGILLRTFQLDTSTKAPVPCFQDGTC